MANVHTSNRSGFIRRSGVRRRETIWASLARINAVLASSADASLMASLNAAALALRPFTVVRFRGTWLARSDQSAASELYIANYGMAVVSDQAIAVGVTAVPTPATDLASDLWFVSEQWIGRFDLVGTSISSEITSKPIDSKAMRKVEEGQDIAFVGEAGIGGGGVNMDVTGRFLLKLH